MIVPLKGICFIERGKENKIRKLTTLEAMHRMFKQIYFQIHLYLHLINC